MNSFLLGFIAVVLFQFSPLMADLLPDEVNTFPAPGYGKVMLAVPSSLSNFVIVDSPNPGFGVANVDFNGNLVTSWGTSGITQVISGGNQLTPQGASIIDGQLKIVSTFNGSGAYVATIDVGTGQVTQTTSTVVSQSSNGSGTIGYAGTGTTAGISVIDGKPAGHGAFSGLDEAFLIPSEPGDQCTLNSPACFTAGQWNGTHTGYSRVFFGRAIARMVGAVKGLPEEDAPVTYYFGYSHDNASSKHVVVAKKVGEEVTAHINDADTSILPRALFAYPNGKVLVVGQTEITSVAQDMVLLRFNADGTRDTSFNTTGKLVLDIGGYDSASSVTIDPEGVITVYGVSNQNGNLPVAARVLDDGSLDTTFGTGGVTVYVVAGGQGIRSYAQGFAFGSVDPGDVVYVYKVGQNTLSPATRPRIRVSKLKSSLGKQYVSLRGQVTLSPAGYASVDPVANGLKVAIKDSDGNTIFQHNVLGGLYSKSLRQGWKPNRSGTGFSYRGKDGAVTSVQLRLSGADRVRFSIKIRKASVVSTSLVPLKGEVYFDSLGNGAGASLDFNEAPIQPFCVTSANNIHCSERTIAE